MSRKPVIRAVQQKATTSVTEAVLDSDQRKVGFEEDRIAGFSLITQFIEKYILHDDYKIKSSSL